MNSNQYFMIRAALIQWAYRAPIQGRSDAVGNARAVLLFFASVPKIEDKKRYTSWYSVEQISTAVDLGERATYRAIQRLIKAGYIDRYQRRATATFYYLGVRLKSIKDNKVSLMTVKFDRSPQLSDKSNDDTPNKVDSINNKESEESRKMSKNAIVVIDKSGRWQIRATTADVLDDDKVLTNGEKIECNAKISKLQTELFNEVRDYG